LRIEFSKCAVTVRKLSESELVLGIVSIAVCHGLTPSTDVCASPAACRSAASPSGLKCACKILTLSLSGWARAQAAVEIAPLERSNRRAPIR
jgi:hypothetical protein